MEVIKYLNKLGYTTVSSSFYDFIQLWKEWYKGKSNFHKYSYYNGKAMVSCERKSLGMAKKVAEDKADLLLNEKVSINLSDDTKQDILDNVLDNNSFWVRGNQLVELSQALGTGAIVEYLDGEEIKLDYIQADCIFPLTWDNGNIIECAFASEYQDKGGKYIYINIHTLENEKYVVTNKVFNEEGKEALLPEGLLDIWPTGSSTPLFQIIKPNIVNNIETTSPMGISVFGNSIDILEGIDLVYDSYDNEFRLGKKRIFVDSSVVKVDLDSGNIQPTFDSNDTVFYGFPLGSEQGKNKAIEESDMTLRAAEHEMGLQNRLNILSSKCGFGQNYYDFNRGQVKTATEVISENSQLYRRIKKDEIILEKALIDMVRAILFLSNEKSDEEVSISFDDSIIEDAEAIHKRAMLELQAGIIDNVVYYQRVYGYTEEQALNFAKEIQERTPEVPYVSLFDEGEGNA